MKSELTTPETAQKEKPFPKLMICKNKFGVLVIFATEVIDNHLLKGTVVYTQSEVNPLGSYSNAWGANLFKDLDGKITLSND